MDESVQEFELENYVSSVLKPQVKNLPQIVSS